MAIFISIFFAMYAFAETQEAVLPVDAGKIEKSQAALPVPEDKVLLSRCHAGTVIAPGVKPKGWDQAFEYSIEFELKGQEAVDLYRRIQEKGGRVRPNDRNLPNNLGLENSTCYFLPQPRQDKYIPRCLIGMGLRSDGPFARHNSPQMDLRAVINPKTNPFLTSDQAVVRVEGRERFRFGFWGRIAEAVAKGLKGISTDRFACELQKVPCERDPKNKCDRQYCEAVVQLDPDSKEFKLMPVGKIEHVDCEARIASF